MTLVISLFVLIAAWRFADSSPLSAIGFLYVIPIAILSVSRGVKGGIIGVAAAMLLTVTWGLLEPSISLSPLNILVRGLTFAAVAVVVGWQVDRGQSLEREANRWFEMSSELCCVANYDGYFTRVNSAWSHVLGYTEQELLSAPFADFVHPDDIQETTTRLVDLIDGSSTNTFENRYRAKDGSWHWLAWSCRAVDGAIFASARDITDRKEFEAQLSAMANQDSLTGLPNRRSWDERVRGDMSRAERAGTPLCIAMLDLDRLKEVNDAQGHEAGDRLLRAAAAGWNSALREGDTVARLGGDEFAVILPDCTEREALVVVERMAMSMPDNHGFSAGVARWDRQEDISATVARADKALYAAKEAGRARIMLSSELGREEPTLLLPRSA